MKKILLISIIPLLFACNNADKKNASTETSTNEDSLKMANAELSGQVRSKDEVIESFVSSFNEIQDNLKAIGSRQKTVSIQTESVELKKTQQEQIISDIQFINEMLTQNRKALSDLTSKLKSSDEKRSDLEKILSHLNTEVNEKEQEIDFLKNKLSSLNIKLSDIDAKYEKEKKASAAKTEELNTAYCTIGTSSELIKQGLITKKGGFVGLGKIKELDANLTKGMFSGIDIYQTKEISIAARKVKIVTDHTKGSYKLEDKYHVKTLVILNPDEFWKTSKYLIIEVSGDKPDYE